MKNQSNIRAQFVFEQLSTLVDKEKENQKEFRSLARSFPTMVHTNGLTAAVAYLYAKAKNKDKGNSYMKMSNILYDWYKNNNMLNIDDKNTNIVYELARCIANLNNKVQEKSENNKFNSFDLQLATEEAMALLVWVKRIAEGMFESE